LWVGLVLDATLLAIWRKYYRTIRNRCRHGCTACDWRIPDSGWARSQGRLDFVSRRQTVSHSRITLRVQFWNARYFGGLLNAVMHPFCSSAYMQGRNAPGIIMGPARSLLWADRSSLKVVVEERRGVAG